MRKWLLMGVFVFSLLIANEISPTPWTERLTPPAAAFGFAVGALGWQARQRIGLSVAKRADAQHAAFLAGKPEGLYGDFMVDKEFLAPEYTFAARNRQRTFEEPPRWRHDRIIGGDTRDVLWPRIANELVRINHLASLTIRGAQDQSEMIAIQNWLRQQCRQMNCSEIDLFAQMASWMRQRCDIDMDSQVKTYTGHQVVGENFPWHVAHSAARRRAGQAAPIR